MDLKAAIEAEHSKSQTNKIVRYIGDDKKKFKELVTVFLQSEYRVTQRAAWPLSEIAIAHNDLIVPYLKKLVEILKATDQHPAIPRNILRIFSAIDIPEKYHGELIDICFGFITEVKHPIAVRAFAITVASHICSHYPELKNELVMVLEELRKYPQPPAITVRIKSAVKQLNMNK
ncbi:MAG: hypothetical protein H0W61_16390 [Bacteroidetes bacterium]|nr:hypothetical protein [Bacteroidota bacterium]